MDFRMRPHYRLAVVWRCFLSPHPNLFLSHGTSRLSGPPLPRYTDCLWSLHRHFSDSSRVSWRSWRWAEWRRGHRAARGRLRDALLSISHLVLRFHFSAPSRQDLSFLHHCQLAHGNWLSTNYLGLSGGSDGKESACNRGDLGLIPGLGRSPGEGSGNPFSNLAWRIPMDRGTWWATVHGLQRVGHDWASKHREVWHAAVHGVAESDRI